MARTRTYVYIGEAEQLVPHTVDGPRVVVAGDEVRLLDHDESFADHPLWKRKGRAPKPDPTVAGGDVAEIPTPDPEGDPDESSDPDEPESQEPTA